QLDVRCCDVLLQALELRGPGDRDDPGLLGEQPRERDLSRCRVHALCYAREQLDEGAIRFPRLRIETRDAVAEVGAVERRALVDLAREEPLAQRAEGNEADSELLQRRHDLAFRLPPPQRVLALQRGDGLDRIRATDRLRACFGEAEVLDLSFFDQSL